MSNLSGLGSYPPLKRWRPAFTARLDPVIVTTRGEADAWRIDRPDLTWLQAHRPFCSERHHPFTSAVRATSILGGQKECRSLPAVTHVLFGRSAYLHHWCTFRAQGFRKRSRPRARAGPALAPGTSAVNFAARLLQADRAGLRIYGVRVFRRRLLAQVVAHPICPCRSMAGERRDKTSRVPLADGASTGRGCGFPTAAAGHASRHEGYRIPCVIAITRSCTTLPSCTALAGYPVCDQETNFLRPVGTRLVQIGDPRSALSLPVQGAGVEKRRSHRGLVRKDRQNSSREARWERRVSVHFLRAALRSACPLEHGRRRSPSVILAPRHRPGPRDGRKHRTRATHCRAGIFWVIVVVVIHWLCLTPLGVAFVKLDLAVGLNQAVSLMSQYGC